MKYQKFNLQTNDDDGGGLVEFSPNERMFEIFSVLYCVLLIFLMAVYHEIWA